VSTAKPARVPGIIQELFPAYHGVAWYWREFGAPAHPHRQGRYLLRFGAVDYLADVWVNDLHLGGHEGSETPFVLDATDAVKPGLSNRLAVRVLNPGDKPIDGFVLNETPHRNKMVHYVNGNGYDIGGIIESVELLMAPAVRIENLYVRTEWKTGKIQIQANVRNTFLILLGRQPEAFWQRQRDDAQCAGDQQSEKIGLSCYVTRTR
jgi:beta-galactosidase/beta-glucuronidase